MSIYTKTLLVAIPAFIVLMVIEALVARSRGLKINRSEDVISSLSSGLTNTIKSEETLRELKVERCFGCWRDSTTWTTHPCLEYV